MALTLASGHPSPKLGRGNFPFSQNWEKGSGDEGKFLRRPLVPNSRVEEGLPLAWHLDTVREHGFAHVDCFWRSDRDAIYGGIRT